MGWNQDVTRILRFIPEFEKKEAAISAALIETRKLVSDLNKITEGHCVIEIGGKEYLDKSEVEKMISDFASKKDVKSLEVSTSKLIDERLKPVATKIDEVKSIEHLSISDVNEALKPYELTKDANGKIKSCRDTMGESYDLYTKSLDKKLSSIESGVDEFKKSQSLAYDKLEKETSKSIIETGQKLEKSILKKVLDKISKLVG
ncbi:hypothetical protein NVP1137O_34 [Vibrio phage 1.137.O._10N.261.46.B5]|nr:hypothetical protein NVP1119O_38 [Vibrio phage 1.119.O._10N.261.51.A9]AUR89632.1 hypothetical protein NVP1127O_40 [Vibrio phage 1.127.O._10N.286.52.E12]AUR90088.1 hypothetical protein NVP1137O_34 [Vibrio phage 1.137.O._10N.261.46.B5]AUR90410.1 hypothetical protein NVP1143O_38 [Vibrio phage 1.143.O._10N.261.55.C8]AUR96696.1 hypothetical protein NVP1231O_38 [Vibrio phage 1.231.O._10N.261.49.F8]